MYFVFVCFSLLAGAITWNVVAGFLNSLPKSFQEAENEFLQIVTASENPKTRWRTCTSVTNIKFEYVTALLYANKYLSEDTRKRVRGKIDFFMDGGEERRGEERRGEERRGEEKRRKAS